MREFSILNRASSQDETFEFHVYSQEVLFCCASQLYIVSSSILLHVLIGAGVASHIGAKRGDAAADESV